MAAASPAIPSYNSCLGVSTSLGFNQHGTYRKHFFRTIIGEQSLYRFHVNPAEGRGSGNSKKEPSNT